MNAILNSSKTKIVCIISIIVCLILKLFFFNFNSPDYLWFLESWVEYIKNNGYFYALKDTFHNYTPLYIYILVIIAKIGINPLFGIKIVSILFEFTAAFFVGKMVNLKYKNTNVIWLCLAIVPFIPTVFINSAILGQCDSIYSTFVIASVYFLFKNKNLQSMVMLGIAVSLKAQTAFVLPFYFIYLMRGGIKWYYFLILPAVYLITITPALILGCPADYLFTAYGKQAAYYDDLGLFLPNIYIFLQKIVDYFPENQESLYTIIKLLGAAFMVLLTIASGILLKNKKYTLSFESWIKLLFLSVMISPFFLPGMHERYLYLSDLVAILYILIICKKIYLPAGMLFISFYSYIRFLYDYTKNMSSQKYMNLLSFFESIPWEVMSLLYFTIIIFAAIDFSKSLKHQEGNL